ncbi:hypothetical protein AgCh_032432 [Apium graveolens]
MLIATGTLRLNPRTLALIAVHRQTAASASTSPPNRLQHGCFGAFPISPPTRPPSTLEHAPNLNASLGHVSVFGVPGNGGLIRGSGKPGILGALGGNAKGGLEGSGKPGTFGIPGGNANGGLEGIGKPGAGGSFGVPGKIGGSFGPFGVPGYGIGGLTYGIGKRGGRFGVSWAGGLGEEGELDLCL